jgi:hypothetical protein
MDELCLSSYAVEIVFEHKIRRSFVYLGVLHLEGVLGRLFLFFLHVKTPENFIRVRHVQ